MRDRAGHGVVQSMQAVVLTLVKYVANLVAKQARSPIFYIERRAHTVCPSEVQPKKRGEPNRVRDSEIVQMVAVPLALLKPVLRAGYRHSPDQ